MARTTTTSKTKRKPQQLGFKYRTWGGKRKGAGRKRGPGGGVGHHRRPPLASRHPVHITLKVVDGLPSLRQPDLHQAIETCLREVRGLYTDFRVVHYSVQDSHLHLIVEAVSREALSRGMQGLSIRIAKRINKVLGRKGKVFAARYFEVVLRSPRQTRNALRYVLCNTPRHAAEAGMRCEPGWIDPCSSGAYFDGWRGLKVRPPPDAEPPVSDPNTWMLKKGWRRHGLIPVDAVPGRTPKSCRST